MLTKSTNTKYSYLRRVMVLPILIATVCLVSIKVYASEKIEKTAKAIEKIEKTVKAIQNSIDLLVSDTTKPKKLTPPVPPTPQNPSSAKPNYYINGVKIAEGAPPPPPLSNPSYYLDGVKITEKEMKDISINGIASINVLKGEQAIKKYREDGKNGVIIITTKKGTKANLQSNVGNYSSISNGKEDNEEGPAVFNAPKIQKDLDPKKNNDPIFYTAEKPAAFPGGSDGWGKYLNKNLNVDLPVKNGAPAGIYTVVLNFVVQSNGEVTNVETINNPGYGTESEAIRVIEKGPKWIPAEQNGKKVNYLVKQTIVFNVSDKD